MTEPGVHRPRELRLLGAALQGSEVGVKGYVTWIYDCVAELALSNPELGLVSAADAVDRDPRLCDRPRFSLGEAEGAPMEASISVVDVPRPPAKPERDAMTVAELAAWPTVPKIAIGDHVVVTGTWATRSPHGEYNSEGLLVYKAVDPRAPRPRRVRQYRPPRQTRSSRHRHRHRLRPWPRSRSRSRSRPGHRCARWSPTRCSTPRSIT